MRWRKHIPRHLNTKFDSEAAKPVYLLRKAQLRMAMEE